MKKIIIKIIIGICIYFICINLITKTITYFLIKDLDKTIDNEIKKQTTELLKKEITDILLKEIK